MVRISVVSIAAALSALYFINSACTQHIIRDRSVFQNFTPFTTRPKIQGVTGHLEG